MNKIKLACLLLSLSCFSARADVPELNTTASLNFSETVSDSPIDGCPPLEESYFSNLFNGYDVSLQAANLDGLAYDAATASAPYAHLALMIAVYYLIKNKGPGALNSFQKWYRNSSLSKYIYNVASTTSYPLRNLSVQDCFGIPAFLGITARLLHPKTIGMQAVLKWLPDSVSSLIAAPLTTVNAMLNTRGDIFTFTLNSATNLIIIKFILNCLLDESPISLVIADSPLEKNYEKPRDEDLLNLIINEFNENFPPEFKKLFEKSDKQDIDQQDVNQSEQLSPEIYINS